VLAHVKSNDGPEMPSLLYEIEPIVLPATAEEPELDTSRLALLGESPHSGRALLASAAASEEERFAKDEAQDFLLTELGDYQRHQAGELFKGARKLGINEKALQRARKAIGAQTEKVGFGSTGAWEWWLPAKATSETSKPAFLRKGDTPREVSPYVESSDLTASGDGAAVAPTPSGPLTFEARELLKQERDRLTREQLEAKDAATAEECRRLQAEAEKVDDADLDYYRSRRDAPLENPLPGDKAFLDYVAGVHAAGAITTGEALEREQHHALILRARKA
jgi:hypothetical protein